MKRKLITLVMASALISASLAGCGNKEVEETEPVAVEEPAVEETPTAGDEAEEEVTGDVETEEPEQEVEEKYICLAQTDYHADGSVETLKKYIYNESGNVLKEITYATDSSIILLIEYECDDKGNPIKYTCTDADGNVTSGPYLYGYEYDDKGNIIKKTETETETDEDGNVVGSSSYEYEYDENGNTIKEKSTSINTDGAGNVTDSTAFEAEYNENGNVIRMSHTYMDGNGNVTGSIVYEYEYDENGNEIKMSYIDMDADGNVSSSGLCESEYDENGNEIKETYTYLDADGNVTASHWNEYEYNDTNNQTTKTSYLVGDGTRIKQEECVYDSAGNSIKETMFLDGKEYNVVEYEYDGHGNMLKESHIDYYNHMRWSFESVYDVDDRIVREMSYSYVDDSDVIESIICREYDVYGNQIKTYYYSTDGMKFTEYEYIELKDYLATKEAIDQEEIEFVNVEPVENILSSSGTLNAETEGAGAEE